MTTWHTTKSNRARNITGCKQVNSLSKSLYLEVKPKVSHQNVTNSPPLLRKHVGTTQSCFNNRVLSRITYVCCNDSNMAERAPHQHQDSRNLSHLPSQTENSSFQTATWPINITITTITQNLTKIKKCSIYSTQCIMKQFSLLMKLMILAVFGLYPRGWMHLF